MERGSSAEGSGNRGTSVRRSTSEPLRPIDNHINLGENHSLSKADLSRALFCSTAVYYGTTGRADADKYLQKTMKEYPSVTFQEVHLSMDKFMLVAYTDNKKEMFIAFKGTDVDSLKDVACNLRIDEKFQYGGSFHSGFSERAEVLMGSTHNPIPLLLCQPERPRVIFCGHSQGGAVAHMALLHFLQDSRILEGECKYHDSLFSVGFGAPHVCDEWAARAINENINLRWRFINFVNQQDPVPRLLHHLKNSLVEGLRAHLASSSGSILRAIGGFIGESTQEYAEGGVRNVIAIAATTAVQQLGTAARRGAQHVLRRHISRNVVPDDPDFYPIGQYVFLHRDAHSLGAGGEPMMNFVVRESWGRSDQLLGLLVKVEITRETIAYHPTREYMSVLVAANFLDRPADCSNSTVPSGFLVSIPEPKVTLAEWRTMDSGGDNEQKYISIKGENLLFLRRVAVNISGERETNWTSTQQSDNMLCLFDPQTWQERARMDTRAVPVVIITTAFGIAHCSILDQNSVNQTASGGLTVKKLSKIVKSLIIKVSPPLNIDPSRSVLDALDDIMQCVPRLADQGKMSKHVREYKNRIRDGMNAEESLRKIDNMNNMVNAVEGFLSSSLKVTYDLSGRQKLLFTGAFLAILGVVGVGVLSIANGLTPIATCQAIVMNPNMINLMRENIPGILRAGSRSFTLLTSIGGAVILGNNFVIIEGYTDVLNHAIEEAIQWSGRQRDTQSGSSVEAYENELITQVNAAGYVFNQMVDELDGTHLKSKLFEKATKDSKKRFLKRIKLVRDIESLCRRVGQDHYIGILGAEDTGKSTFIKKVLRHHNLTEASLLATGRDVHTQMVTAYSLPGSRWILDFPGSNGVGKHADSWRRISDLSTSAVLILDFEFDVKMEQSDMYREMKNMLQTELTVVFNKVDELFDSDDPFPEDYFHLLKSSNAARLGCNEDKVFFACLDPIRISEAEFTELKRIGVVDFEGLARSLGLITS